MVVVDHPRLADAPRKQRIRYARALLVAFCEDALVERWEKESGGQGVELPAAQETAVLRDRHRETLIGRRARSIMLSDGAAAEGSVPTHAG